jgi:hypothetical protein
MNIDVEKIISEMESAIDHDMICDFSDCFTALRRMDLIIDCQNSLILDLHASLRAIKNNSLAIDKQCLDERNRILEL